MAKKPRYQPIGFENEELEQLADDLQAEWFWSASSTFRATLRLFNHKLKEHGYEIRKVKPTLSESQAQDIIDSPKGKPFEIPDGVEPPKVN